MMAAELTLGEFTKQLAAKQPTPGGGGAAAVAGALGCAAAHMAATYTQRKKDVESGAAAKASALMSLLQHESMLTGADADASAYADLQRSWKDSDMTAEQKAEIEATALKVPVDLVEDCLKKCQQIDEFLPSCNPNITSDSKVGIHLLAGAARAAYQTAMVNQPPKDVVERMQAMLKEMRDAEDRVLGLSG